MDKIEKQVVLNAPIDRVWRAISDATQFGAWFGVELDGPFVAGKRVTGRIKQTEADAEIAAMQTPYVGMAVAWQVEKLEPNRYFAFRWHPFAVEQGVDYS